MKKIMTIFGTRPEAIKMCPVVLELQKNEQVKSVVCVTGQHKEMLDQVLKTFNIKADYNLEIMQTNQDLFDITQNILKRIKSVLEIEKPELVLVHGDTSTTFVASLACFYMQIPVGHVEAGLRTYNIYSPFPEEFNRTAVGVISKYNFAPTLQAKNNLLSEGKKEDTIHITGNTVIDALKTTIMDDYYHEYLEWAKGSRLILLTAHRRENQGESLINIFTSIKKIVDKYDDVKVIFPVHPNPKIKTIAESVLGDHPKVKLIEPLDVIDFHNFINQSYIIVSDSGGIQEEAPALGKPVLVLRDTTERPEGITAGTIKLVGTNSINIINNIEILLDDENEYLRMATAINPYGDGYASERIVNIILR